MRALRLMILVVVLVLAGADAMGRPRFVPGRILVKTRTGISETNFTGKLRAHEARIRRTLRHLNIRVVTVPEAQADATLAALRNDPDVEFAERDYLAAAAFVPYDPDLLAGKQWYLSQIGAEQAWDFTSGRSNVVVAVLDSGIDASHADFAGQVLSGYNFISDDNDTADDFGHGTAVAGAIAAAGDNGIGIAGVAYGCRLLPVKVMDATGVASYSSLAEGIKYAVDQGARVINISIVGSNPSSTLQQAIDYAWSNNVLVVAAAGNNASADPQFPAACSRVIGVSATEPDDSLAWFSSYGMSVDLAAPGDSIWTTQQNPGDPYGSWRGTSLASPIVAGVAALAASENPSLSNPQLVSILEQTADDLGLAGCDTCYGYGRVNAYRAVTAASREPGALPSVVTATPRIAISSPADSTEFGTGAVVTLAANAWAGTGQGRVTNVTFLANDFCLGKLEGAPFSLHWTPAQPGDYTLTALAADDQGLWATSAPVTINVATPAGQPVNPYPALRGSYAGLVANTNDVTPDNSGYFGLRVTATGRFTGKLLIGGKHRGFHGRFDSAGNALVVVKRGRVGPLTIALRLEVTDASAQVFGNVTDGVWTSDLAGDRHDFRARSNPAPQAGRYGFVLESADHSATVAATGSSKILPNGVARFKARLDGRGHSVRSALAANGDCPLFLSLKRGREIVIGWLNFSPTASSTAGGTVLWVRTGKGAFATTLRAICAP